MIRTKNGEIHFKNQAELNKETNRRIKKILETEIVKYKQAATKEAMLLILPIAFTALHEAYGFGEKRLQRFADCFMLHMECINAGVTDLEQYKEFCEEQGYKVLEVEDEL